MWRSFLAELPKIRRRGVLMAAVAMVMITGLAMYFGITRIHSRNGAATAVFLLEQSNGLVGLLLRGAEFISVIALITTGAVLGSEWTQGTLRNLLVQEPGRLRMLAGKFAALTLYLLLSGALAIAVGVGVAMATAPGVGIDTTAWWSDAGLSNFWSFAGNLVMAIIAWCVFGTFMAVLVRNAAGAVGAAIAWLIVVEGLVSQVWPEVGRWLPGRLLVTVLTGGSGAISYSSALLWSVAYCAAMLAIAGTSFVRRDVLA